MVLLAPDEICATRYFLLGLGYQQTYYDLKAPGVTL